MRKDAAKIILFKAGCVFSFIKVLMMTYLPITAISA